MGIVCWQTILLKYHTLFFSKIGKDLSSAAVVIGALRVNIRNPLLFCVRLKIISGLSRTEDFINSKTYFPKDDFLAVIFSASLREYPTSCRPSIDPDCVAS